MITSFVQKIPAFLPFLCLMACGGNKPVAETTETAAVPVILSPVTAVVRTEPVHVAGTVSSLEEARLSFKAGGIIEKIYVREGQAVRRGQVLAALDPTEIRAQVSQARLSYEKAERDLQRVKNMVRDTAATLEQLQNATTGFDAAAEGLNIARFNEAFSRIVSPVDGVVGAKFMNAGEMAAPGSPVLMVISGRQSDWVVKVGVADRDWARLKTGDRAKIYLDAYPGDTLAGTVTALAQAADPATRLYEIEVRIRPGERRLATGLFAKTELFPSQCRTYRMIPVEALLEGHGKDGFVYVVKNGRAQKLGVKVGYLEKDKVLVETGLDTVAQVITAGNAFLTDGARIKIR